MIIEQKIKETKLKTDEKINLVKLIEKSKEKQSTLSKRFESKDFNTNNTKGSVLSFEERAGVQ